MFLEEKVERSEGVKVLYVYRCIHLLPVLPLRVSGGKHSRVVIDIA